MRVLLTFMLPYTADLTAQTLAKGFCKWSPSLPPHDKLEAAYPVTISVNIPASTVHTLQDPAARYRLAQCITIEMGQKVLCVMPPVVVHDACACCNAHTGRVPGPGEMCVFCDDCIGAAVVAVATPPQDTTGPAAGFR